jgi:hypothetical protein
MAPKLKLYGQGQGSLLISELSGALSIIIIALEIESGSGVAVREK